MHGVDKIRLNNVAFPKLGPNGALNPAFLWNGTAAHDTNDYLVYNRANGALYYDPNGIATGGAVLLAVLDSKPVLTASDILVV